MDYFIYALDIAFKSVEPNQGNTSWVKIDSKGNLVDTGYGIIDLAKNISSEINKRNIKIALGFEAPMWIPVPKKDINNNFEMKGRFYDEICNYSARWFEGGAQPTVKTLPIGYFLFYELLKQCKNIKATTELKSWNESNPFYLFEGFATNDYKGNKSMDYRLFKKNDPKLKNNDLVDAFIIAQACFQSITQKRTPLFQNSHCIFWMHHLEVKQNRTAPIVSIETKHTDLSGQIIYYSSLISHFRVISIWDIIHLEQSLVWGNEDIEFCIDGPKACDIYGFCF